METTLTRETLLALGFVEIKPIGNTNAIWWHHPYDALKGHFQDPVTFSQIIDKAVRFGSNQATYELKSQLQRLIL